MSRRTLIILGIVAIIIIGGYYGYSRYSGSQSEIPAEPATAEELQSVIWASGEVAPVRWATLSASIGGQVVALNAVDGDSVQADDELLRLDDADLQNGVKQAEAALAMAQAQLAQLQAGVRPIEIAIAEDGVAAAEVALVAAQTQVTQAEAALAGAVAGVEQAQAAKDRLRAGPSAGQRQSALAQVKQAESAVRVAQAEYDKIAWANEVDITPQAIALEQATLNLQVAQAAYQTLLDGATVEDIAAADAAIEVAKAAVAQAQAAVLSAEAGVTQAETAVAAAGHQRDLVAEGTIRAEDIAVAEAAVQQADVNLSVAREALDKAIISAPFAGTVGLVYVRQGEQALPGQPLIVVGDLSALRVETTDLRETDVGRLRVGQAVDLTFDALPDVLLKGHISQIAIQANSGQGGTNYATWIDFDDGIPPALRWGMTAFVNIAIED